MRHKQYCLCFTCFKIIMNKNIVKNIIIALFISVPLTSSVISGFHLIEFLKLGNSLVLAITIAIIYEICSIATLYAIVIMNRLNPYYVWSAFILITIMQYVGNVFYSFDFILTKTATDENFVNHALRFLDIIVGKSRDSDINIFILSFIIGVPIPTLSLFLTKSLTEYLKKEETPKSESTPSPWQIDREDLNRRYNEALDNMDESHKKQNEETLSEHIKYDIRDQIDKILKENKEIEDREFSENRNYSVGKIEETTPRENQEEKLETTELKAFEIILPTIEKIENDITIEKFKQEWVNHINQTKDEDLMIEYQDKFENIEPIIKSEELLIETTDKEIQKSRDSRKQDDYTKGFKKFNLP